LRGNLFQRDDDKSESVKIRLEAYEGSTAPLIEFYKRLHLLIPVAANGSAEEICTRTLSALTLWRTRKLDLEAS
jgi:adenylate kinase